MKTVTKHLRTRLLDRISTSVTGDKREPLSQLQHSQWSIEFEQLMRNRLLIGRFRYGLMRKQKPNGYDNIGSALKRLKLYKETGNLEHLVDAANLCLVEFVTGQHPDKHFEAADDGEHVEKL